jgi:hypothetical protein
LAEKILVKIDYSLGDPISATVMKEGDNPKTNDAFD